MKKRIMLLLLSLMAVFAVSVRAEEPINFDTPICVTINGHYIQMDSEPFLYNGTTYVPIRFISEGLGADSVKWDAARNTAVIRQDGKTIELPANKNAGYINGKYVKINNGVKLVNDRTYVPVRFVSEHLGSQVGWNEQTYTVAISKNGITVPSHLKGYRGYTDDEIYWLSKIIHAESRGEPMRGKIGVGNVILNRVKSSSFPNTIYTVIFDREHGVQFSPVLDGSIYQTPLGDSVIAAKRALRGERPVGASLYFMNPKTAANSWIAQNRPYYTTIANHNFYL